MKQSLPNARGVGQAIAFCRLSGTVRLAGSKNRAFAGRSGGRRQKTIVCPTTEAATENDGLSHDCYVFHNKALTFGLWQ